MKTPSNGRRRLLGRLGALVATVMAASAFVTALAALALFSAAFGGPALVQLAEWISGR